MGRSGRRGGIYPADAAVAGEHLVVIVHRGHERTAVGMALDLDASSAQPRWQRSLPHYDWDSDSYKWDSSSVIRADAHSVYVVAGKARLRLEAHSGAVVAETEAPALSSRPAALSGPELLVPEDRALAAYDTATLMFRWRRSAPEGWLLSAPPVEDLCPVHRWEEHRCTATALWKLSEDAIRPLPASLVSVAPMAVTASVAVVAYLSGERLAAVKAGSGELAWNVETPAPWPLFTPQNQGPMPGAYRVVAHGERVVAAVQTPAVEARVAETGGVLWRVDLLRDRSHIGAGLSQPLSLSVVDGVVWAGTYRGDVLAIDADDGTVLGQVTVRQHKGSGVIAILPVGEHTSSAGVVGVSRLGTIYGLSM